MHRPPEEGSHPTPGPPLLPRTAVEKSDNRVNSWGAASSPPDAEVRLLRDEIFKRRQVYMASMLG